MDVGVGRNDEGVIPVLDERDELDKDEGIPWPVGGLVIGGDFPRRVGGIILGASSVGSSLPRTFSAMRNIARANCSAFNLPFFCVSQRFLQDRDTKTYRRIDHMLLQSVIHMHTTQTHTSHQRHCIYKRVYTCTVYIYQCTSQCNSGQVLQLTIREPEWWTRDLTP